MMRHLGILLLTTAACGSPSRGCPDCDADGGPETDAGPGTSTTCSARVENGSGLTGWSSQTSATVMAVEPTRVTLQYEDTSEGTFSWHGGEDLTPMFRVGETIGIEHQRAEAGNWFLLTAQAARFALFGVYSGGPFAATATTLEGEGLSIELTEVCTVSETSPCDVPYQTRVFDARVSHGGDVSQLSQRQSADVGAWHVRHMGARSSPDASGGACSWHPESTWETLAHQLR
jgi:hypothetical protein